MCFSLKVSQFLLVTGFLYLGHLGECNATVTPGIQPEIQATENVSMQEKFEGEEYFCIKFNNMDGLQIQGERQMATLMCFVMNGLLLQTPDTLGLFNCLSDAGL